MITALSLWLLGCGTPTPAPTPEPTPKPTPATPAGPPVSPIPERLGLGHPADAARIAAWDIDVDAEGHGLPPGQGTVAEGEVLYTQLACSGCHGPAGEGGVGPKLVGTEPTSGFGEAWKGHERTIGNWWPYATTVYDYVHRAMPQTAPGSLSPEQTYALTAFLLAKNGAVPMDFVADADTLPKVKMPTKVKFVQDDREETATFR